MNRSRQLPLLWPHRPSTARDDLVVGPSNELAVAALDAWPDWPHPVLYVAGPEGSGKSHLGAAWSERSGALPFAPGIERSEAPFAVFLDDLGRARRSEEAVFALLNAARLGGGTVLVAAHGAPATLDLRLPDLVSRLQAATMVTLGVPDEALLLGVLVKLFADRQIEIDPRLVEAMLPRMERSLDAARRLVERIDRETLASGRKATRALVLDLLAEMGDKEGDRRETVRQVP
ncbi:hypothetical protein [Aureimonas populi]|uniref:Chromosomal replication initiator protein DnaA domain-containing protein n=1 Tax=Aureimonas populi TaxID=1701758 RepID=A0ABW5CFL2_9HYPH|nr:hypothetical protein [Aureimonas populi]